MPPPMLKNSIPYRFFKSSDDGRDFRDRFGEGLRFGDLGTDVHLQCRE